MAELAHIVAPGADLHTIGLRSIEKKHEDLVHADEPAGEGTVSFCISPSGAPAGLSYTSFDAPRLAPSDFRRMLSEAESH